MGGIAPVEVNEARGLGAGAADGVDHGEVGAEEIIAHGDRDVHAVATGEVAHSGFQRIGPQVIGRGVDEIARQNGGLDLPLHLIGIGALGQGQNGARLGIAIAVEPIGTKLEADGGQGGIADLAGKAIGSGL